MIARIPAALLITSLLMLTGAVSAQAPTAAPPKDGAKPASGRTTPKLPKGMKPYEIAVPNCEVKIRMIPVPHPKTPFWMSETEVTWDAFDEFVFEDIYHPEDFKKMKGPDAVARPSKPYIPPDRGYGHEGFAAISLRYDSAKNFCTWLAKKTSTEIRLAKEDEWEHACLAGAKGPYAFPEKDAKKFAWWYEYALKRPVDPNEDPDFHDRAAQPVRSLAPNAWGLYDMHGNVAEWVLGRDGKPVLKGGSWMDDFGELAVTKRQLWQSSWQQTDPQIPKSSWWLSDGPFAGMRIVRSWSAPKTEPSGEKKSPVGADKTNDTKKESKR